MIKKSIVILQILLALAVSLSAQAVMPLKVMRQDNVKIPWGLTNLSVVDGRLYGSYNGVLFSSSLKDGMVLNMEPDTTLRALAMMPNYVVGNPCDSMLYYTTSYEEEVNGFYVHTQERWRKYRQVELRSWFRDINHPTFSADGNMVVFSSNGKVGLGGYDLWASFWNGKRWSKPINMGNVINTQGNEVSPVFYGRYLIYASDGIQEKENGYKLYAVRVKLGAKADDIIFDNYVVQQLPEPINSRGNNVSMAFDTLTSTGYWVSTRSGREELYSFHGDLEGVMLSGRVVDDANNPVADAKVRILHKGRVVNETNTDLAGKYQLFLPPNDDYLFQVGKDNYFRFAQDLAVVRTNENTLITPQQQDVVLSCLPFNRPLRFDNIYQQGADIELTVEGENVLNPIVDFLRDNPKVKARLSLFCDQSTDADFNNMIIERRISNLNVYLKSVLPTDGQISFKNGNNTPNYSAQGSGENVIFVTFFK